MTRILMSDSDRKGRRRNDRCHRSAPPAPCDQGLSVADVGNGLGVQPDRLHRTLAVQRQADQPRPVCCSRCKKVVASRDHLASDALVVFCLPCLRKRPDATFAERLIACRLAAGLTRGQVAARVGGSENTILSYEFGRHKPGPVRLAALVQLLGPELLPA
jgi:DNA-binding XRE family transcriptional regulator